MDLTRWLRASRVADPKDAGLLHELAVDMLDVVALDPTAPRAFECAAACELAIASYHALAGDWTLAEAVHAVKSQDAGTRAKTRTALAVGRMDAKVAWGKCVAETCIRVRAVRNLSAASDKRKVLPFRKVG